jgi:glyoxylase-like metal-dependent hydrolase (beta-lactamase superfamily II)
MAEFFASRRIGGATVTVISDGTLKWAPKFPVSEEERAEVLAGADSDGKMTMGLNFLHVNTDRASVVVDPGCDDPASAWQRHFGVQWPGGTRTPGLAAALRAVGVRPEDVSHVVITHSHADHLAGVAVERNGELVPRFPRARHLVGRADWEDSPARRDPKSDLSVRLGLVARSGQLELVDGECELAPGIALLPSPGETPGHLSVRLTSGGQRFYYVGDLFHLPCEVEHIDWAPPNRDVAALRASRARVIAEAASPEAMVMFTHDRFPAWGRIVRGDGGVRWESIA